MAVQSPCACASIAAKDAAPVKPETTNTGDPWTDNHPRLVRTERDGDWVIGYWE